jgi:hypothetical protein
MICKDENSFQQLGDVRRDPSRLILAEQLSGRAPAQLILENSRPLRAGTMFPVNCST